MAALRLASFTVNGRESYGAVTDQGIVDLGRKLTKYPTLRDVFRAQAVGEARAAATGAADYQLKDVDDAAADPAAGEEHLRRHQLSGPRRRVQRRRRAGAEQYPNLFMRVPTSLVGNEQPIVRPKVSEQFDYEGEIVLVIGKEGRHIPQDKALSFIGGLTLGNEGSVRDWLRHGTLNVTQGKNFDNSGSLGPGSCRPTTSIRRSRCASPPR